MKLNIPFVNFCKLYAGFENHSLLALKFLDVCKEGKHFSVPLTEELSMFLTNWTWWKIEYQILVVFTGPSRPNIFPIEKWCWISQNIKCRNI